MPDTKAPKILRNEIKAAIDGLNEIVFDPDVPIPQRTAASNRAQELFQQLVQLEAARFNAATARYETQLAGVIKASAEMKLALSEIGKAIKAIEKAQKLFGAVDKLLKIAAKFI